MNSCNPHSTFSKSISLFLAGLILFSSCASTTMIQSNPEGAKLYLNGEPVGTTPYSQTDTKIMGSTNTLRLEKEGYEPLNTSFSRNEEADVGAIIGGIFVLVPFLWTMKYNPIHNYELVPISTESEELERNQQDDSITKSKADKLRERHYWMITLLRRKNFKEKKRRFLKVTTSTFIARGLDGWIDS